MTFKSFTAFLLLIWCVNLVFTLDVMTSTRNDRISELEMSSTDLSCERANEEARHKLRILCLGASITWGQNSASGNGYRKLLRDRLQRQGNEIDMIGTKKHGNMKDNNVEATPGETIDQVKAAAQRSLHFKPNIVLINAGTNDCAKNIDILNAGRRMRSLIENIVHAKGMSKTVIVLSTLLFSKNDVIEKNRTEVNRQYRELVPALKKEGVSIYLADMDPPKPSPGNGWIQYPDDYKKGNNQPDPTHPNDAGYEKMAEIWFKAVEIAAKEQKIPDRGLRDGTSARTYAEDDPG